MKKNKLKNKMRRLRNRPASDELAVRDFIASCGGPEKFYKEPQFNPLSYDELTKILLAGKRGEENPLFAGPVQFAVDYCLDEYNRLQHELQTKKPALDELAPGFRSALSSQDELFANFAFMFFLDEKLFPYLSTFRKEEFIPFTEEGREQLHEETRSIVFDITPWRLDAFPAEWLEQTKKNFSQTPFKTDAVSGVAIWLSTPDLYVKGSKIDDPDSGLDPNEFGNPSSTGSSKLNKHSVKAHKRNLKSGKIVLVRPHQRSRLTEAGVPWDGREDYIVYNAFDSDGELRYIGEGRPERPNHVNSGISHNFNINQHFFLKGPMKIKVVHEGLTKPTALAIERLAINKEAKTGQLWNIKDNPAATTEEDNKSD